MRGIQIVLCQECNGVAVFDFTHLVKNMLDIFVLFVVGKHFIEVTRVHFSLNVFEIQLQAGLGLLINAKRIYGNI